MYVIKRGKEKMIGKSRKGIAATSLIALLLVTVTVAGLGYFATQLVGLLETIIGNLFWLGIGVVIVGGSGLILIQSIKDKLENTFLAIGLIVLLAVGLPLLGLTVNHVMTSWEATTQVQVSQNIVGYGDPKLETLSATNVQETGPNIFSIVDANPRQACAINCDEWEVDLTLTCEGEVLGEETISGKGEQTVDKTWGGLEAGKQCEVTATPGSSLDGTQKTATFTTR